MITDRYLTLNKFSRCGKYLSDVRGIVVHYVGVNNQSEIQVRDYFESLKFGRNNTFASAHYIIGLEGNGIHCIPDDEVAYHCGAKVYKEGITDRLGLYPNSTTIGIEMCHLKTGFTESTIDVSIQLIVQLLLEHNLTIDDLYRHYDITGKLCPKFFVEDEDLWKDFKNRVKKWL